MRPSLRWAGYAADAPVAICFFQVLAVLSGVEDRGLTVVDRSHGFVGIDGHDSERYLPKDRFSDSSIVTIDRPYRMAGPDGW